MIMIQIVFSLVVTLVVNVSVGTTAFAPVTFSAASTANSDKSARPRESSSTCTTLFGIRDLFQKNSQDSSDPETEYVSICIIGGGVSGLTAAITAADQVSSSSSICVVEASPTFGGRVQSDVTEDGFTLDRGFAVFIEKYPLAQELLNYDELKLAPFLPGALVKIPTTSSTSSTSSTSGEAPILAKVADPLRQPQELFTALLAPVGTLLDKIKVLPLLFHVFTNSVQDLFDEPETSTLDALEHRWGFSSTMIDTFYRPFLEGIYLAPLEQQSSRMFHFVMKMFSEGAATLPQNGIGAVSQQLMDLADSKPNVSLIPNWAVESIQQINPPSSLSKDVEESLTTSTDESPIVSPQGNFLMESSDKTTRRRRRIVADHVIVATDASVAESLVTPLVPALERMEEPIQRSVGCLYYTFPGEAPISEPILILSGEPNRGISSEFPINNICFPSVVVRQAAAAGGDEGNTYAPPGQSLCSVTILKRTMARYKDRPEELDRLVKKQLATWFPDANVMETWTLKRMYSIPNAQPSQWTSSTTNAAAAVANINGGRDCTTIRGVSLPTNMFMCGDFMATATLNGALESGINAGKAAAVAAAAATAAKHKSTTDTSSTSTTKATTMTT